MKEIQSLNSRELFEERVRTESQHDEADLSMTVATKGPILLAMPAEPKSVSSSEDKNKSQKTASVALLFK